MFFRYETLKKLCLMRSKCLEYSRFQYSLVREMNDVLKWVENKNTCVRDFEMIEDENAPGLHRVQTWQKQFDQLQKVSFKTKRFL